MATVAPHAPADLVRERLDECPCCAAQEAAVRWVIDTHERLTLGVALAEMVPTVSAVGLDALVVYKRELRLVEAHLREQAAKAAQRAAELQASQGRRAGGFRRR